MRLHQGTVVVHQVHVGAHQVGAAGLQRGMAGRQTVGKEQVVGIEDGDELAARLLQRSVQRAVRAQVAFVARQAHARIGAFLQHLPGGVGRGIVNDDQLQVAPALLQHAVQRRTHKPCVVIGGDQDADQWLRIGRGGGVSGVGHGGQRKGQASATAAATATARGAGA